MGDEPESDFQLRRVTLSHSGYNYDAYAIGSNENISNKKWTIIAGGNLVIAEEMLLFYAKHFNKLGSNILYINGPGVARSTGVPTAFSIGAGQEAGLQFLEKVVGAKKIVMFGYSLGGSAHLKAIFNHDFKRKVKYLVWSDRTFNKLADAAGDITSKAVKYIFPVLGIDLNCMPGAHKLKELKIPHIVTQNNHAKAVNNELPYEGEIVTKGDDGIIHNTSSLYVGCRQEGIVDKERIKFYGNSTLHHNDWSLVLNGIVNADIQNFLNK